MRCILRSLQEQNRTEQNRTEQLFIINQVTVTGYSQIAYGTFNRNAIYTVTSYGNRGTYILQTNRASFNQNVVDPTCLLCKTSAETLSHFLIECATLESIRQPILRDIEHIHVLRYSDLDLTDSEILLQLLTDCSIYFPEHLNPRRGLKMVFRYTKN